MTANILEKLVEHNNWANAEIIRACSTLSDEQLDAEPQSATEGTIRHTLWHLVDSEQGYLSDLIGIKPRFDWQAPPAFAELQEAASSNAKALLALAREGSIDHLPQIHTGVGYSIEPWVVMVQIINHATEHREQIKSMLSSLGVTPPRIDGWAYGRISHALTRISS